MTEQAPRTKAGRALLDHGDNFDLHWRDFRSEVVAAILAIEAEAAAPDPVASPADAVRLLEKVLDEFDFWVSKPRPAIDGGTVRIHNFQEVQPNMERTLDEARRYLATEGEAGT